MDNQPMSPSRHRAPRVGASIKIAALLVTLAASISPLVPYAAAVDPSLDPGATPTVDPAPAPDPTATADPIPTPTLDPPVPTEVVPTDPAPTPTDTAATDPAPTPTLDPALALSAPEPGAPGPSAVPGDPLPLYPLVPPLDGGGPAGSAQAEIVSDLVAAGLALAGPLGPSSFTTPHVELSLTGDTCAACHRAHTGENQSLLTEAAPQAGLCFTCHNSSNPGSMIDVQSDFTNPANVTAHPATIDLGHVPGMGDEFAGRLERHATCADCHDPHNATATLASVGTPGAPWGASGAILGVSGLVVLNGGPGSAPVYALVRNVTFEYQLCFKCHSGYTQLPARDPDHPSAWALDKGIELNPANGSYHPIEAAGTNGTAAMSESLAGGVLWQFGTGDTVRCVNCHSDPSKLAADPAARLATHASTQPSLLIAPYRDRLLKPTDEAYQDTDFTLCFLCHSADPFTDDGSAATNFELHAKHVSDIGGEGTGGTDIDVAGDGQGNAVCAECHFRLHSTALAVKPGDVNNARLVNFAPNVQPNGGVLEWAAGPSGSCTLTCHGQEHAAEGYGPLAVANVRTLSGARISLASTGTTRVGSPATFTVTVEKDSGPGFVPAAAVPVSVTAEGSGAIDADASTCDDGVTDDFGQCLVVVASGVTGDDSVSASVIVGDVTGVASMTAELSVHDVASWVDARLSIDGSGTGTIDTPFTLTVTVERDSGSGFRPATGVTVNAVEIGDGDIDLDASTCDEATDGLGQCVVVLTSAVAGLSSVDAVATVTVPGAIGSFDLAVDADGSVTWEDPSAPVAAAAAPAPVAVDAPAPVPLASVENQAF